MSPLVPPVGLPEEIVLVPKPLEFVAILIVLDVDKSPPPVRPPVPVMVIASAAAPNNDLASVGLPAPVPPDDILSGCIPEILPPVINTLLASCVAIVPTLVVLPVPNPSAARAAAAVVDPVPPCVIARGVVSDCILPPVI